MRLSPPGTATSEWISSYPAEIMVCDPAGTILEMSGASIQIYRKEGGAKLIGRNVFDHHHEPSKTQMMNVVKQKKHVIYTTERKGMKKLVSIAPWYRGDEYAGFALIVLDLPATVPNIIKD